jgi:hypothetical protein
LFFAPTNNPNALQGGFSKLIMSGMTVSAFNHDLAFYINTDYYLNFFKEPIQ